MKGKGVILVFFCSVICLGYVPTNLNYDGIVDFCDFATFTDWWSPDKPHLTDLVDLNCDGNADFNDFVVFTDQWLFEEPNFPFLCDPNSSIGPGCLDKFKFCRTSTAYNSDGTTSADNEVQWRTFALVSQSVVENETIYGLTDLLQCCENDSYIFSVHTYGSVYRKAKYGGSWEKVADNTTAQQMWAFRNGSLFGAYDETFRRSVDNGQTWTEVTTPPDISLYGYFLIDWSFACSDYGTAIMVEYGHTGELPYGRRIFRSTDGGDNWTTVFDAGPDFDNVDIKHMHAACWHGGTGKFVVSCGDTAKRRFLISDDDGITWMSWKFREGLQPTQLLDYGHPTKILCGSDYYSTVYTLDLETGEAEVVIPNWNCMRSTQAHCFVLRYFNDIFYAFEYDERHNVNDRRAKISVSKDLENWAVYYQFTQNEHGVRYCSGVSDGKIHATAITAWGSRKTIAISEAKVTDRPLVVVNPASENLLDSPNKSVSDTDVNVWDPYIAVCELADSGGLFATRVPRFTMDSPTYDYMKFRHNLFQATIPKDGRQYICRFWARGNSDDAYFQYYLSGASGSGTGRFSQLLKRDRWYEFCTAPLTYDGVGGSDPHGRLLVIMGEPNSIPSGHEPEVYIGGVTINKDRSTFQMGGTPRAKTKIVKPVLVGNGWTSFLTIVTDARAEMLGQYKDWIDDASYAKGTKVIYWGQTYEGKEYGNINNQPNITGSWWDAVDSWKWHIKTWGINPENRLTLYLDSIDMKLKLDIISQGVVLETLVESEAFPFEWQSQMDFAIRVGNGEVTLTIAHGGICEHVSSLQALPADYMANDIIIHRLGSQDDPAMVTVPFYLYHPDYKEFDYVLTDSEVWTGINRNF